MSEQVRHGSWREEPEHWFVRGAMRVIGVLGPVLRAAGVDRDKLGAILRSKLLLDVRRGRRAKKEGTASPFGGGFLLTCAMNLLFGVLAGGAMIMLVDPLPAVGFAQILVMAFGTLVLVSDYSAVLLETSDEDILGHAPVGDRTVFAARVLHILIYLGMVEGSLAVGPLVFGSFLFSPFVFVPVFLLITALSTAFCIGLAFGFYMLAMRYLDMERFKEVVLYFQVAATVAVIGGLQLLPHVVDLKGLAQEVTEGFSPLLLLPPFHQGGLMALALGEATGRNFVLAALAVGLPLGLLGVTLRLAASGFTRGLRSMASGDRSGGAPRLRSRGPGKALMRSALARAGYEFFAAMSRRERQYRMRTWPMVAVGLVIGVAVGLRHGAEEGDPAMLCGAIYLVGLYSPQFVLLARFSDDHRARWLFDVAPIRSPQPFVAGSMAALVTVFVVPAYLFVLLVVLLAGGSEVWADAVLASEFALLMAMLTTRWLGREIPFTREYSRDVMTGQMGMLFLLMLVTGLLVTVHVVLRQFAGAMYVAMAVLFVVLCALGWALRSADRVRGGSRRRQARPGSP